MTWLFTLLAMAVIALIAGVVTGRIAGAMEPPQSSLSFRGLPPDTVDPVDPADVDRLRFDAAVRGYRMRQVDQVLDRLAAELRRRDDEIAALRAELAGPDAADPAGTGAAADSPEGPLYAAQPGYLPEADGPAYAPPSAGIDVRGWPDQGKG